MIVLIHQLIPFNRIKKKSGNTFGGRRHLSKVGVVSFLKMPVTILGEIWDNFSSNEIYVYLGKYHQ